SGPLATHARLFLRPLDAMGGTTSTSRRVLNLGMIAMTPPPAAPPETSALIQDLARCLACGIRLRGESSCPECGRGYPVHQGILEAIGVLEGRNRIAAAFYDGPGWRRFRPWEQGFLILQGGPRKARFEILRHVLKVEANHAVGLEVGIGAGANLALLP